MNTEKNLKAFEVTAAGFNGATDETDNLVFWVLAPSSEIVEKSIEDTGAKFCGELPAVCIPDAEFELPRQVIGFSSKLLEKASEFRCHNR